MIRNFVGKVVTALLISTGAIAPAAAVAAAWDGGDWPKQVEGRVIEYLIITANYESPRDLAAAIQEATRNPILLLPAADAESSTIYLILPDGKAPVPQGTVRVIMPPNGFLGAFNSMQQLIDKLLDAGVLQKNDKAAK